MIDTSSWKEFRVGDLFRIEPAKGKNQQELIEGDDVPYIAASKENNGFNRMVSVEGHEDWVSKGNCLQFVHIGDAAAGHVNYIPSDFIGMSGKSSCAYNDRLNEYNGLFIASIIVHTNNGKYSFKDSWTGSKVSNTIIKLPATSEGQPDWDYMESYMKAVMEESEKSLENLRKADDTKHLIDVSRWGEFKLSDLFTKRTMKGYPKKAEVYDENENGYHIYGQNIGWQYPYKVLMDEQYLHKVEPDKPILAYASSVGEIGLINESFYRSGDNGAFQGLFPIGYHPNLLQMQFVLSILKKEFEKFRYDTSMQNTMDITFKLPITSTGEPDWQYMEDYMRRIMDKSEQIISDLQIGA